MVQMPAVHVASAGTREAPAGDDPGDAGSERIAVQLHALYPAGRVHLRDGESVQGHHPLPRPPAARTSQLRTRLRWPGAR